MIPLASAAASTWSRTARTWSRGYAPWNSGSGWPASTATTVGTLCAWNAWAICGFASASMRARSHRPASSSASDARSAATVALASLRGDHRTTTTGCCVELCTRSGNVAWSTSTTYAPGDGSPPGLPGGGVAGRFERGQVDRSSHVEAGTGSGGLRHASFFLRGLGV